MLNGLVKPMNALKMHSFSTLKAPITIYR